VQAFSVKDDQYRQPIGEDANVFRLQVEDLVNAATTGAKPRGATAEDGLASVRAMVALAKSVTTGDWVKLDDVTGGLV
jgi:predicted dehydrogenase